jgi:phage terminase large subunit-like protein
VTEYVAPAYAVDLDALELSDVEALALAYDHATWRRPGQIIPTDVWRSIGFICGRGWGKSWAIASWINDEVEAGRIRWPALMAPNEDRVDEVAIAFLIATAPPWFKPRRIGKTIEWPNGVRAETFTPEAPGRSRSGNFDFAWLIEIVDWNANTRAEAFENITTATRRGLERFVWDTTSKGLNEVLEALEAAHAAEPSRHRIVRGTTLDSHVLSWSYMADEVRKYAPSPQRLSEELLGLVFRGAAGALWSIDLIGKHRRPARPARPRRTLVCVDPAVSVSGIADDTGIVTADEGEDDHVYVHTDDTGRHAPDAWAQIVVDWCSPETIPPEAPRRAAVVAKVAGKPACGVLIERNRGGDLAAHAVVSEARARGLDVQFLDRKEPFPKRRVGVIYIREVTAASSKDARAFGPATEYVHGHVHVVGQLPGLEGEMCTYVPGRGKSPNRYDAHNLAVTELAGLEHDHPEARAKRDVAAAVEANRQINARLRRAVIGKRLL